MLAPLDNSLVFKKLFTDREVLQAFVKDVTGAAIDPATIETDGLTPTERRIAMEEQGYEDHLALREQKGRRESQAEIAAAMLAEGFAAEMIAKVTGLPVAEILKLPRQ